MFKNSTTLFNYYKNRKVVNKYTLPKYNCGVYETKIKVDFSDNCSFIFSFYLYEIESIKKGYSMKYIKDNETYIYKYKNMDDKLYNKIVRR